MNGALLRVASDAHTPCSRDDDFRRQLRVFGGYKAARPAALADVARVGRSVARADVGEQNGGVSASFSHVTARLAV